MMTRLPGRSTLSAVPTMQSTCMCARTNPGSISSDSAPAEILDAQLDFVTQAKGGLLTPIVRSATVCLVADDPVVLTDH